MSIFRPGIQGFFRTKFTKGACYIFCQTDYRCSLGFFRKNYSRRNDKCTLNYSQYIPKFTNFIYIYFPYRNITIIFKSLIFNLCLSNSLIIWIFSTLICAKLSGDEGWRQRAFVIVDSITPGGRAVARNI